jgi:predicted AlkP superfamily phosphohydrolase/phosphomutase
MTVIVDRKQRAVTLQVQGKTHAVAEKQWSDWIEWSFEVTPQFSVHAISRVYAHEVDDHVRLYMTCLQVHPRDPYLPLSAPRSYSCEIADRYGLYRTVGWSDDTKALQQDELNEEVFLEVAKQTMAWQAMVTLDEIEAGKFDVLVAGWTSTDRVAHMFWRFRDPKHPQYSETAPATFKRAIESVYAQMDEIAGKVMSKLRDDDLLIVLSDHGFQSYRTNFSVNTWLARNSYLAVKGQTDPAAASSDTKYLQDIDWSRTKVYGLGLGSVFLNIEGREGQGIVRESEAPALLQELKDRLMSVTNPQSGERVFHAVYTRAEAYKGVCEAEAPDLQLGYVEGYQTNKASAAGAVPKDVFSPNDDKWSGEHAAADFAHAPGILFCNRATVEEPALIDIGVTILRRLNIAVPQDYEGKDLRV